MVVDATGITVENEGGRVAIVRTTTAFCGSLGAGYEMGRLGFSL